VDLSCSETLNGVPVASDSVIDLTNRKVKINAQPGETVECTFTSEEIAPTSAPVSLTGQVVDTYGYGVRGVRLSLYNGATGQVVYATTNSFGYYAFTNLPVNSFYVLSIEKMKGYTFSDSTRTFSMQSDLTGINFVASKYRWL
jgi:hypothetical protein